MRNLSDVLSALARRFAVPTPGSAAEFVRTAYQRLLGRKPTRKELTHWIAVTEHRGAAAVLALILDSDEHQNRRRLDANQIGTGVTPATANAFVDAAFRRVLRRAPTDQERAAWAEGVQHRGPGEILEMLFDGDEYAHRNRVDDLSEFYAGHFYSPVIDPEGLKASGFQVDRSVDEAALAGLDFRTAAMVDFWTRNAPAMAKAPIAQKATEGVRYHTDNDVYTYGDAVVLTAMMAELRPQRIVEVGSGFSSACMLDVADRLELPTQFTFIEPYPERLLSRLSEADHARCTILKTFVQATDPAIFEGLQANDILFIDSTHVSKAGSDVNHELFEVLPRLASGVIVHFHDIFYPFEYPEEWIFKSRRSWNEAYILRAFLTNNPAYEMVFFNDYFRAKHPKRAAEVPKFLENPGGGLWLRKV